MGVHQRWRLVLLLLVGQVETWNLLLHLESLIILGLLVHDVFGEEMPEVKADLEQFLIRDATHLGQIGQALQGLLAKHSDLIVCFNRVCKILNKIEVVFQD